MQQNILRESNVTKIYLIYVDNGARKKMPVKLRFMDNKECYFAYRMYDIAHEVTELLNYQITDTRAYNKVSLIGFQRRDYSDNFHGIQIIFNFMLNSNLSGTPALSDFKNRMVVRPH